MTALAEESAVTAAEAEEGFIIEELPAFGEEDQLIFPEEEPAAPAPTPEPADAPEPAEEVRAPEEDPPEDPPEDGAEAAEAASPAPAEDPGAAGQNTLPVIIIIAAVLAAGVIAVTAVRKRKPANRAHLKDD